MNIHTVLLIIIAVHPYTVTKCFPDWSFSTFGKDSEMEPFDRWTKIRRRFKCILWLEDYHDLDDVFKGHLGVVGLLVCEEPVSHLILQPKLLNCVRSHVDLYCFEEPSGLCLTSHDRRRL